MVTRRSFLGFLGAGATAPAIVKAENLMKIFVPPAPKIVAPMQPAVVTELALLGGDFDGDMISVRTLEALGITPELLKADYNWSVSEAIMRNNQQLTDMLKESSMMIRYPIVGAHSVSMAIPDGFKPYW